MPIIPISKAALSQNGFKAFVRPCKRITLTYCNWGGSSQGMRNLLTSKITDIAAKYPDIEFIIQKKSGHPTVEAVYSKKTAVSNEVKNMSKSEISTKIVEMINKSGDNLKKPQNLVESRNESIRGIWSPMHVAKRERRRI